MDTTKITKGEAAVIKEGNGQLWVEVGKDIVCCITCDDYGKRGREDYKPSVEQQENAEIIKEVFNTANQCGLSPAQLKEQRDELLMAAKTLRSSLCGIKWQSQYESAYNMAESVIEKIEKSATA